MTEISLRELAGIIGGDLVGDGSITIGGVAGIGEAGPGTITFLADRKYDAFLKTTAASAVIAPRGTTCASKALVLSDNPYLTFVRAVEFFVPGRGRHAPGIHPTASVAAGACLGSGVHVGPNVVIGPGAVIGDGSAILAGTYVGAESRIGSDCLVYPNVTIREDVTVGDRVIIHSGAVIGSDGFGFTKDGEVYRKIPQIGTVVVEDDVEIGANVTIDRATTGTTLVGKGTKIDNLVQIGHNVTIGENCILVAQVGVGGSTELGRGVTLAGQSGVIGHIKVGDGAVVAAQAGVTAAVPAGVTVSGYPAKEHGQAAKVYASLQRLPDLLRKVADLAQRVKRLEEKLK
ncbi:MAG: UDP-3-O-(3-hydroxymyristoyl)glucosamine N-acyltransferase [bacterium]